MLIKLQEKGRTAMNALKAHCDVCQQCKSDLFNPCTEGTELILAAHDEALKAYTNWLEKEWSKLPC